MTPYEIFTTAAGICSIATTGLLSTYILTQRQRLKDMETLLSIINPDKLKNINDMQRESALLLIDQRVHHFKRDFKKNVTPLIKEGLDKLADKMRDQFDEMANVVYDDVIMTRQKSDRRELIEIYLPKCKDIFIPMLEKENEI